MEIENEIYIEKITSFSPELTDSISHLLSQLNSSAPPLENKDIREMIDSDSTHLFVARHKENQKIVGMVTLITYRIPFKMKGVLEDAVVDSEFRNRGIGKSLLNFAISFAKEAGVKILDLTSNPKRVGANMLYQKMGFEKRETNVYRLNL